MEAHGDMTSVVRSIFQNSERCFCCFLIVLIVVEIVDGKLVVVVRVLVLVDDEVLVELLVETSSACTSSRWCR